jgi:hypothetical protein
MPRKAKSTSAPDRRSYTDNFKRDAVADAARWPLGGFDRATLGYLWNESALPMEEAVGRGGRAGR